MDLIFVLLIAAGALALGGVCGYLVFRYARLPLNQFQRGCKVVRLVCVEQ